MTLVGAGSTGQAEGQCTGEATAYPVTVAAGAAAFVPGTAGACATALNTARGVVQDGQEWCRAGGVTLVAG